MYSSRAYRLHSSIVLRPDSLVQCSPEVVAYLSSKSSCPPYPPSKSRSKYGFFPSLSVVAVLFVVTGDWDVPCSDSRMRSRIAASCAVSWSSTDRNCGSVERYNACCVVVDRLLTFSRAYRASSPCSFDFQAGSCSAEFQSV